jgi:peptidoglycan DL-endopeptidase CwlO
MPRIQPWRWVRHATVAISTPLAAIAFMASPAIAAPGAAVPSGGSAPTLSDLLILPASPVATPAPATDAIGPLAGEIINAQNATERLGEQLKAIGDTLATAQSVTGPARARWEQAHAAVGTVRDLIAARKAAASPAPSASPDPSASPSPSATPTTNPATDPGGATPATNVPVDDNALAAELATAQRTESDAKAALDAAILVESEISGRYSVLNEQFQRAQSALSVLKARNADQVASIDSARDHLESTQAAARSVSTAINGMVAGAAAQKAVAFALSQLGKPYAWAEEGPDSYDCSGLTFASYLSVGIRLPRVAVDQYLHGPGAHVPVAQLLPGDLLFFSTDHNDASKIHHVAMYLGGGRMVHAPNFGEHVKEAPVWWTEYYGALRVVPAVAAPGSTPTTPAPTATQPAPTPTSTEPAPTTSAPAPTTAAPPADPAPTATPTDPPTTAPTASPSADPTGAPAPPAASPSPSPAPAPSPTQTTTAPAPTSAPASPSPSPTPTPTPSPSPGPTPSALLAVLGTGTLALPRPKSKPKA